MPKKQKDSLFQLIKSLNKAEKRHFKLYSRRNAATGDPLFLKLFDFLDRQKQYQEEAIYMKVPDIKRSQLANIKSHLYKQLLVSLRLLHRSQNIEILVREYLDFAQILYAKGLYRQSLTLLDRAKNKAVEINLHSLALEIISFEKLIESQYVTGSMAPKAEELASSSFSLAKKTMGETRFSNLSLELYGVYLTMGYARNKTDLDYANNFFREHLPPHDEREMSFFEKLYLYQSYVWLYNISQDFARQYRYSQKWVSLFHANEEMIPYQIPLYLKGIHNLLNTLYMTLQQEKFERELEALERFNEDGQYTLTKNEASLQALFTYIHRINRHYMEGSFAEGKAWMPELVEKIQSGEHNWDEHRIMVFYYRIACIYFGSGDNEMTIEFLNKIINNVTPDFRGDIQSFARILSLIAHFELGNDILVSYQLKSVYRFLSKMEELNEIHKAIFNFLRRTPQILKKI
jgi:hypothetical protein